MTSRNKNNIQVAVRIRPLLPQEKTDICNVCTRVPPDDSNQIWLGKKAFIFNQVFDMSSKQSEVYDRCIRSLVEGCFDGFNASVLAYGQTGSGKTYTMGTEIDHSIRDEDKGIIIRAVEHLFQGIYERQNKAHQNGDFVPEFTVNSQFFEIYNDDLIDLLSDRKKREKPRIHLDRNKMVTISGIETKTVTNVRETLECLQYGSLFRSTGSTLMNARSSRSHAIFSLLIKQIRVAEDTGESVTLIAKLNFVDLAGSERLNRTGAVGERAREGISINSGLLHLGKVISTLADQTRPANHIPYRNSKLTFALQDSLGGNSVTTMIACVSPCDRDFIETVNTLRYAERAKKIQNNAVINKDYEAKLIDDLRRQLSDAQLEIQRLKQAQKAEMETENSNNLRPLSESSFLSPIGTVSPGDQDNADDDDTETKEIKHELNSQNAKIDVILVNDLAFKDQLINDSETRERRMEKMAEQYEKRIVELKDLILKTQTEKDLLIQREKLTEESRVRELTEKSSELLNEMIKLEALKSEKEKQLTEEILFKESLKKMNQEILELRHHKIRLINEIEKRMTQQNGNIKQKIQNIKKQKKKKSIKEKNFLNNSPGNFPISGRLFQPSVNDTPERIRNKWSDFEQNIYQMAAYKLRFEEIEQKMQNHFDQRKKLIDHINMIKQDEELDTEHLEKMMEYLKSIDEKIREDQKEILGLEDVDTDENLWWKDMTTGEMSYFFYKMFNRAINHAAAVSKSSSEPVEESNPIWASLNVTNQTLPNPPSVSERRVFWKRKQNHRLERTENE